MATVIDQLIISLSLNTTGFTQGQQQAIRQLRQFQSQATTSANSVQNSTQAMVNGFQNVTREILGLGAAFLGVSGLKDLVIKTVGNQDALGKTASLLDVNSEALNRWINAVRLAGGTAAGAQSSISALVTAFGRYQTGQAQPGELGLHALGALNPGVDWQGLFQSGNWEKFLVTLSGSLQRNPGAAPGVRRALANDIPGVGDDLMLLLQQGPDVVKARLAEAQTVTEEQLKAARHITEEFTRLSLALEEAVNRMTPQIESWAVGFARGATQVVKDPVRGAGAGAAGFMAPILGGIAAGERWLLGQGGGQPTADVPLPRGRPYTGADVAADAERFATGGPGTGRWIAPYLNAPLHHETLEAGGFGQYRDVNTDNSSAIHIANVSITPPPGTDAHAWASTFISSVTAQASSGSR